MENSRVQDYIQMSFFFYAGGLLEHPPPPPPPPLVRNILSGHEEYVLTRTEMYIIFMKELNRWDSEDYRTGERRNIEDKNTLGKKWFYGASWGTKPSRIAMLSRQSIERR